MINVFHSYERIYPWKMFVHLKNNVNLVWCYSYQSKCLQAEIALAKYHAIIIIESLHVQIPYCFLKETFRKDI